VHLGNARFSWGRFAKLKLMVHLRFDVQVFFLNNSKIVIFNIRAF
jgi:hypothetical protein